MEDTTMNNEIMDNDFVQNEAAMDFDETSEYYDEKDGFPVGAIVGGVLGTAAIAGITGLAVKNKDKIKDKLAGAKAAHEQKKLERLEKKAQAIEEAKKKYVKIDENK